MVGACLVEMLGLPPPFPFCIAVPSRATVTLGENNVQSLRWSLTAMRSGIGLRHWKRVEDSKNVHCLQQCNWAAHFGQVPAKSVPGCRAVAQL
jgi:hypothetical protein